MKYVRTASRRWSIEAGETWTGTTTADQVTLTGQCPRCDELVEHTEPRSVLVTEIAADESERTVDATFTIDCDCRRPHPGRDDGNGQKGCGARWYLRASGGSTLVVESAVPVESPSEADLQAVADAAAQELAGVRKYAETWQKALAGLVALAGTFLFLKGADAPSKLNNPAVIALLAVLGLACAAYAALEAANAVNGRPVAVDALGPEAAERIAQARSDMARSALESMNNATLATLIALALLVAAILGTWIDAKSGLSSVSLTVAGRESPACGSLESGTVSEITLKDANGATTTFMWDDVQGMSLTASC
jgi:hypothetical protein